VQLYVNVAPNVTQSLVRRLSYRALIGLTTTKSHPADSLTSVLLFI